MESKQIIRQEMRKVLTQLRKNDITTASDRIIDQLVPLIDQYTVRSVFLPMIDEPQIQAFISLLLDRGKTVIVPQIDANILEPFRYTDDVDIRRGAFGVPTIQDPIPYIGKIDVILVPGLAFTVDGKRLGRGQGYYDTFLAQYPQVKKIWLCFAGQLVKDIPMGEYDVPVNTVIHS